MYDALTARYTFACPHRQETRVPLSDFRLIERLPGPAHPAVYGIRFDCGCGEEHPGLVPHPDLDWAPLGGQAGGFFDLMTSQRCDAGGELLDSAAAHVRAGEWPWTFFCYLEARPRPVFPSSFVAVAPGERWLGLAVRCPVCGSLSVNVVSRAHVDLPFWNDEHVGVVDHVFAPDALRSVEEFRAELDSARFDERRIDLQ